MVYAGGKFNQNNTEYYLYSNKQFWTMTPFSLDDDFGATVLFVGSSLSYYFAGDAMDNNFGVRPVINLKADVTISSGNGTATDPYVIS